VTKPSTDEVDVVECYLSPIKLRFVTSKLNVKTSSSNNNFDKKQSPDGLNKSFSETALKSDTIFKTPIRPVSRSTRGSVSENRPKNSSSNYAGETTVPSCVRSIKSVEDLRTAQVNDDSVELTKIKEKGSAVTQFLLQSSEYGVAYFREVLGGEYRRLTSLCDLWDKRLESDKELMSEDMQGDLLSVVGQGRLIISERFSQFSGLVDNCEYKLGEKETKTTDLRGFWDMIYNQVVDVDKKFDKLCELHQNGWVEKQIVNVENKTARKTLLSSKKTRPVAKSSSGLSAMIAAKRREIALKGNNSTPAEVEKLEEESSVSNGGSERQSVKMMIAGMEKLAEVANESKGSAKRINVKEMIAKKRKQLANERGEETASVKIVVEESINIVSSPERTFEGGFFSIKSPNPHNKSLDVKSVSKTRSSDKSLCSGDGLRRSVLHSSGRRLSGLVSPYLSQVARRAVTRRSFKFDDNEDVVSTPPPLDSRYLAPATPSTPLTITTSAGLTWSSSSEEPDERKAVQFLPDGEELASPNSASGNVPGTPHTKSGKKLTYERVNDSSNSSPGLRKARVSLLPLVSGADVTAEENLIMLGSPAREGPADDV